MKIRALKLKDVNYGNQWFDEVEHRWISQAEVAEVPFTAFTSHPQAHHITARLIVRRVKRLNPNTTTQGELLPGYWSVPEKVEA